MEKLTYEKAIRFFELEEKFGMKLMCNGMRERCAKIIMER